MGHNMTLHFETFETVVFFLSVLVVNCKHPWEVAEYKPAHSLTSLSDLIQDGKSNYLEGAMLIGTYVYQAPMHLT